MSLKTYFRYTFHCCGDATNNDICEDNNFYPGVFNIQVCQTVPSAFDVAQKK